MIIIDEEGIRYRIMIDEVDLDDYVMKFATQIKQAHDEAMTVLSELISNNLQV